MSRPDTGGESLESILAAIRKSLAEQATDVLEEEVGAPVGPQGDAPAAAQGSEGFFQRLRDVTEDTPQAEAVALNGQEPTAALVEAAPPAPDQAPVPDPAPATAPAAAPASNDPLWFLGRVADAPAKNGTPAAGGPDPFPKPSAANLKVPIAEARARADIVRGPLPPFFGSSPEAAKVEVAPMPASPLSGVMATLPPADVVPPSSGDVLRGGAETAHAAPRTQPAPGPGVMSNGKAGSHLGAAADGRTAAAGDGPTQNQALEVMVAELLRPMLRRWLDENMPRLVSAALRAEAALLSERDSSKKS
jgi:cell pole-organizing protein PopZ